MYSRQPRKQRKALYNAVLHVRQKLVAAHLSKDLRKSKKKRSMPVKKGDTVKVMRGKFKGRVGKVARVELNNTKIFIEGILVKKQAGKEVMAPIEPSNILITELQERK